MILKKRPDLEPVDVTKGNQKRNPHREFPVESEQKKKNHMGKDGNDSDEDSGIKQKVEPLI